LYAVAFKSEDNKQLDLSVVGDAGYALILPWMPVPVSMITLTQVVSGTSTVVARTAIGREIPDFKHLALTVNGNVAKVYFRGRLLMTGTLSTTMSIDRIELQGGTKDTLLSEMLLMSRVAEPEDIAMWHNLRAPFYDPTPVIQEDQIPAAETWNKAVHDAQRALADAANAQATADGKVTTFYQDTEPIAEALGDLWVHTGEDNKLYRWSGSSWEVVQDKKIQEAVQKAEDAQATADGKIVTFYQSTPPTATTVGDLWVDTDDNDRLYRWDGTTWVDITDKSPVDAEKKPVYVKGAGADIDIDRYGIRATRKADGKKTFEIDAETGNVHFEGDGVFRGRVEASEGYFHGRVEAEEGYFRGDITGASGTFSGNLSAESITAGIVAAGGIKADWYADIRNVLPFNYLDSLDSEHSLVCDFHIPTATVRIVEAKLSVKGLPFRAYARSARFWDWPFDHTGSVTFQSSMSLNYSSENTGSTNIDHSHSYDRPASNTSSAGEHSHSISNSNSNTGSNSGQGIIVTGQSGSWSGEEPAQHSHSIGGFNGAAPQGHTHSYISPPNSTDTVTGHTHNIGVSSGTTGSNGGTHSHSYSRLDSISNLNSHTHELDISHEHGLEFGIHEDTTPADVTLEVNNGDGWSSPIPLGSGSFTHSELDISDYISGTGWKQIRFKSSRLGRINAQLILKIDLTA
jgi:hypothetical protein